VRSAALRLTAALALGAALTLSGCGQKGPLYLPDKKKGTVVTGGAAAPAQPASAQPTPAPEAPPAPQKKDSQDGDSQTPQ
jgi:predicted small lipoprotein YifL